MNSVLLTVSAVVTAAFSLALAQPPDDPAKERRNDDSRSSVNYWSNTKERQARKIHEISSSKLCDGTEYFVGFSYAGADNAVPYRLHSASNADPFPESITTSIRVTRKSPQKELYSYEVPQSAYADLRALNKFSTICPSDGNEFDFAVLVVGGEGSSSYQAYLYFSGSTFLGRRIVQNELLIDRDMKGDFTCFWCQDDSNESENPGR